MLGIPSVDVQIQDYGNEAKVKNIYLIFQRGKLLKKLHLNYIPKET